MDRLFVLFSKPQDSLFVQSAFLVTKRRTVGRMIIRMLTEAGGWLDSLRTMGASIMAILMSAALFMTKSFTNYIKWLMAC